MGRPTKDDRRHDYLDIGASLLADTDRSIADGAGLALAHVRLADVADRAGVTKGALYHIWPSQEAFWSDLLDHLLAEHRLIGIERVREVVAAVETSTDGPVGMPAYLNAIFEYFRDDPSFFTRISLYAYLNDDATRRALDRQFHASLEAAREFVETSLEAIGRRPRPSMDIDDLLIAAIALLEGLCLEYRADPESQADVMIEGVRWTTFALGAEALTLGYTEEVER